MTLKEEVQEIFDSYRSSGYTVYRNGTTPSVKVKVAGSGGAPIAPFQELHRNGFIVSSVSTDCFYVRRIEDAGISEIIMNGQERGCRECGEPTPNNLCEMCYNQ